MWLKSPWISEKARIKHDKNLKNNYFINIYYLHEGRSSSQGRGVLYKLMTCGSRGRSATVRCHGRRNHVRVNKNNLRQSKQDMIETFFLKNRRYFTKAWTFYMLVLKTGVGVGKLHIFSSQKYLPVLPVEFLFCHCDYLTREGGRAADRTD